MVKRIRFGVRLGRVTSVVSPKSNNPYLTPYEHVYWPLVKEIAQECERLGYDSVIMPDHPMSGLERYSCWSTLSALAACTSSINLGTLTTNTMRYLPNPSIFIKEIATLDHISDGRLFPLGMGLGWIPEEYEAYGFKYHSPGTRLAMLRETIQMMRAMFNDDVANYQGKYFSIKDLVCQPKPIQRPFPICVGGTGDRLLKMAAEEADLIDILTGQRQLEDRIQWIEKCCTRLGRDFEGLVKSWGAWFWIYGDSKEFRLHSSEIQRLRSMRGGDSTGMLMGTPEEIVSAFEKLVELGVSYFTLRFEDLPSKRGLRLFASEVFPAFR